jgi:hypothetical protein
MFDWSTDDVGQGTWSLFRAVTGVSLGSQFRQPHCSQPTSTIEHVGTRPHYIWEGKSHPALLSESLWEGMRIDLAVANSRHFYRLVISYWLSV